MIVPLFVAAIVLLAEPGIAKAELYTRIPVPLALSVPPAPVDTLILPVLAGPIAAAWIPYRFRLVIVAPAPPVTMMLPVPAVNVWMADAATFPGIVSANMFPERLIIILLESAGLLITARIAEQPPRPKGGAKWTSRGQFSSIDPPIVSPVPVTRMPPRAVALSFA